MMNCFILGDYFRNKMISRMKLIQIISLESLIALTRAGPDILAKNNYANNSNIYLLFTYLFLHVFRRRTKIRASSNSQVDRKQSAVSRFVCDSGKSARNLLFGTRGRKYSLNFFMKVTHVDGYFPTPRVMTMCFDQVLTLFD